MAHLFPVRHQVIEAVSEIALEKPNRGVFHRPSTKVELLWGRQTQGTWRTSILDERLRLGSLLATFANVFNLSFRPRCGLELGLRLGLAFGLALTLTFNGRPV